MKIPQRIRWTFFKMDVFDNISTRLILVHNPHMVFLFLLSFCHLRRISRKPSDFPSCQVICTVNWFFVVKFFPKSNFPSSKTGIDILQLFFHWHCSRKLINGKTIDTYFITQNLSSYSSFIISNFFLVLLMATKKI